MPQDQAYSRNVDSINSVRVASRRICQIRYIASERCRKPPPADDEVSQSHSPEVRTRATSSSRYVPAAGSPADHAESDRAASQHPRAAARVLNALLAPFLAGGNPRRGGEERHGPRETVPALVLVLASFTFPRAAADRIGRSRFLLRRQIVSAAAESVGYRRAT